MISACQHFAILAFAILVPAVTVALVVLIPAHAVLTLSAMTALCWIFTVVTLTIDPELSHSCALPLMIIVSVTISFVDAHRMAIVEWEDGWAANGLLGLAIIAFFIFSAGLASERRSGSGAGILRKLADNLSPFVNDLRHIAVSHKYSILPQYDPYSHCQTLAQPAAAAAAGLAATAAGLAAAATATADSGGADASTAPDTHELDSREGGHGCVAEDRAPAGA
ncbi:hypothetical protein DEU56DRAFT_43732 [Suillus clintonianus]|uniref:uncharacterized protein n=1 Tax=Suillus clintonianus TaxID=1904413 RepID=UPI001B8669A0|nr:uncharacterized protein DEU56DRAFT_43732 [Suillus clintonianus]KAG2123815.1 hypothetical protein DEU56DRAFT_43732 [Suillus clintonianus]